MKREDSKSRERQQMVEENVRVFAAKFGEKAERTIKDQITVHNYPYGKPNRIFSVGEHPVLLENIFASTIKGVSYLGTIDDFNMEYIVKSDEFVSDIPMGYTTLDIYERMSVYEDGKRIWNNSDILDLYALSDTELKERKLEFYVAKKKEHYAIYLPDRVFDGKFCIWMGNMKYKAYANIDASRKEEVEALAEEFSKRFHVPCLVAKLIYSCNWH